MPEIPETTVGAKTLQRHFVEMARRDKLMLARAPGIGARIDAGAVGVTELADHIEEWWGRRRPTAFNVPFAGATGSLHTSGDYVVPELQRRGIFHKDYAGNTLRENLRLPRPVSGMSAQARPAPRRP